MQLLLCNNNSLDNICITLVEPPVLDIVTVFQLGVGCEACNDEYDMELGVTCDENTGEVIFKFHITSYISDFINIDGFGCIKLVLILFVLLLLLVLLVVDIALC